ncbi:H-NS histone family protein [Aquabacterium sp. A7-Y]|uniref:H-NS histone family protein n=1 Tax=Aquabacterium sp. A7-Y TaxID=1349605 RepID=UPI00223D0AC5|nr:H-NS histone family protein [Aquabacterium sp. A7-Y]MCW7536274.1 H-NS histone family protein [Aquabacterium sp. A7-Y]
MLKTYAQLQEQMEALRRQMEAAKRKEGAGVLKEIKKQIALYGFTAEDVFGSEQKVLAPKKQGRKASASVAPKYQDGNGNSWSGRGPRPAWLRAALESGEALESFLAKPPGQSNATGDGAAPAPAKKRRVGVKKATAKKPGRQVNASGKKPKAGAAALDVTPKQGRKRAAAPKAATKPVAKTRRSATESSAREVTVPIAAPEDAVSQAAEA